MSVLVAMLAAAIGLAVGIVVVPFVSFAIALSGALVFASRVWPHLLRPTWPVAVVPGAVAFVAAFLTPLVGPFPLIAAALFGIPAAGVAAYVWS